jgi:hypothetical protein
MPDKRYVAAASSDGWLLVKPEPFGVNIALPEYLAVDVTSSNNGRDHFTALEGVYEGKTFSVIGGHLKPGNPGYRTAAKLHFNIGKQLLNFPGGQVKAITSPQNPVATGSHPIQIPDFPHDLGSAYLAQSQYAKNWFYLGQGVALPGNNDRYLHTGRVSAGCVTVDPGSWTVLYRYLILCRSGDGKTVGAITVVAR